MTKALAEIAAQLEEPFPIAAVGLLPKGTVERDGKTLCMAFPFADPRAYEDRLNALAPGEWSTPPPVAIVAGQKLIVYVTVTVCGVTHTDVGEAAAGGENAATESWAQAFKRACSQFGLGRYLYDLEKAWVPYNKQSKQIALDASGIQNIVRQMYNKAHVSVGESTSAPAPAAPQPAPQITPSAPAQPVPAAPRVSTPAQVAPGNGIPKTSKDALADLLERTKRRAAEIGVLWDDVKRDAGLSNKPDGELKPFEIGKMNGTLTEYEKRVKSSSAA